MKKIARILTILIPIILFLVIVFILVLTNINFSNLLLGWTEYQTAEFKDNLIKALSILWWLGFVPILMITILIFWKKRTKWWLGLIFLIASSSLWTIIGVGTTISTFKSELFQNETKTSSAMKSLLEKPDFKNQEVQLINYSLHFRNPVLKTGSYAVTRVLNPKTKLQDEYWYDPTNPIFKWSKNTNEISLSYKQTINYQEVPWAIIPKLLKETDNRVKQLPAYYRGVSIVILSQSNDSWIWTVSAEDIRGYTTYTNTYSLDGEFIAERTD
ncbi:MULTISPECIES: hypothetical protein [unclassified Enterococcus]|uniref:hypothetical protein n=1 Tax=unclassified Enterococcus TaxID=2608891 RepID=UPI001553A3B1|nr:MULTISPECIES: hypothetical protein [unclassified Enterococcus]MBS7576363.1 hypothetical protein [Enterococcus sp. MMGLQ5-2]MBS7583595.1 hypothetical protein [Enterococcus sp. MMGLQ5-1]NPD11457.1 hypothetical protein [Enterococcus sp. MMGLQ5-1]NPD36201.1 hypothetical protein [Enterococcus sp. MMGLQ5-2]